MPTLRRLVLFGSLAAGTPTPRSDADLLAVVTLSPHEHARDRLPERARRDGDQLVREALEHGVELCSGGDAHVTPLRAVEGPSPIWAVTS